MIDALDHYRHIWGLRVLKKLVGDRPTSQVLKVEYQGQLAVLKLLTPLGAEDERFGALALSCWAGHGAARLYASDARAHLLEFVDGPDAVSMVLSARDDEASQVLGHTLARLHSAYRSAPPSELTPPDTRFSELFDVAKQPGHDPIFRSGAETARELLSAPLNEAVLHGDLHHENVLHSDTRGWLAIDAKGLRGETTYEGAMAVLNPQCAGELVATPERIAQICAILANRLGVSKTRLLRFTFAHVCMSASWAMETDAFSSSRALKVARLIQQMLARRAERDDQ